MATEKQVKANKANAKKGGVKTKEGKAKSKMNALKHGLLSMETIISNGDLKENLDEYETFCDAFYADLKPVGALECLLAERIISSSWKLRRAEKAENGSIQKEVCSFYLEQEIRTEEKTTSLNLDKIPNKLESLKETNPSLFGYIIPPFESAIEQLKKMGYVDDFQEKRIASYFLDENFEIAANCLLESNDLLKPKNEPIDEEESEPTKEEKQKGKEEVLGILAAELESIKHYKKLAENARKNKNEAYANYQLIPPEMDADRLTRYSTSIENQLYRAIEQLKRLQTERKKSEKMGSFGNLGDPQDK